MTVSERKALKRDMKNPLHLFTIIAENNPVGLSEQFQSWGWTYSGSTKEQMVAELMKAYNAGGQARDQALTIVRHVKYQFGVLGPEMDLAFTGEVQPLMQQSSNGTGESSAWYSDVDWGGIIDSVFTGVGQFTGGGSEPAPGPTPGPSPQTETTSINPQWIIVGVVAIVLIAVIALVMRK
jgi:hypothetical protein